MHTHTHTHARTYAATPGAVLFSDVGAKAAGHFGRVIVSLIIYSLDATRCVILHLAATQSLRHIFPPGKEGEVGSWDLFNGPPPPLWQCGAVVLVGAALLVQVISGCTGGGGHDTRLPLTLAQVLNITHSNITHNHTDPSHSH